MQRYWSVGAATLAAFALCACVGSTTAPLTPSQLSYSSGATQVYGLTGERQTLTLPAISTFAGQFIMPSTTVLPGTLLTVTTSLSAPENAPSFTESASRRSQSGHLDILVYITFSVSQTVTFSTLPALVATVSPTINTGPPAQFFYAISDPTVTNVAVSFRTEGPATVSGQTLRFAASPIPLTLLAGKRYIYALYGNSEPTAIATRLYVANYSGNSVSVFDLAHGDAPLPPISNGLNGPTSVALDATGALYVPNGVYPFDFTVSVFDTAHANTVLPPITGIRGDAEAATVDASGKLYVADDRADVVLVFDTTHANAQLARIDNFDVYCSPFGVAVGATGKLFVACFQNSTVAVRDTQNGYAPLANIVDDSLSNPTGLTVDAAGRLYVANSNGVSVFDTVHGDTALPSIRGGGLSKPSGVAIDSNGKLYVSNGNNGLPGNAPNSVSVFDTAHGNAPLTIIKGGGLNNPQGVAVY